MEQLIPPKVLMCTWGSLQTGSLAGPLLIDTTAALPILHVFMGKGKANMHGLIMEWAQCTVGPQQGRQSVIHGMSTVLDTNVSCVLSVLRDGRRDCFVLPNCAMAKGNVEKAAMVTWCPEAIDTKPQVGCTPTGVAALLNGT